MNEKKAFVFPGQGSQKVGMIEEFYETRSVARELIDSADLFYQIWGYSHKISDLLFSGPQELLNDTRYAQPALFTAEAVVHTILSDEGVHPDVVSGHSAGMFGAYFAAGSLSFLEGLRITTQRGEIMAREGELNPGKMAAVRLSSEEVDRTIRNSEISGVYVANDNSPEQTVVSGREEAVLTLSDLLTSQQIAHKVLPVSIASHSPLMREAKRPFSVALEQRNIYPPTTAIVLDTTACLPHSVEEIKVQMAEQLVSKVLWVDTVLNMIKDGASTFVEVGPGKVLSGLIKKIDPNVSTFSVSDEETLEKLLSAITTRN